MYMMYICSMFLSCLCNCALFVLKHNSLRLSQIKCHDFICEDTFETPRFLCVYTLSLQGNFESEAAIHLSGIYTITCQKILGNPYQCNSSYIRSYISVSNMPGEKQKFIPYLAIVLISPLQQPKES